MTVAAFFIGFAQLDQVPPPHVAVVGVVEKAAQQTQGQGVTFTSSTAACRSAADSVGPEALEQRHSQRP